MAVDLNDPSLTLLELATLLQVPERTLRGLVAAGKFPKPFKVGRAARWSRSEVETHLAETKATRATEVATQGEG